LGAFDKITVGNAGGGWGEDRQCVKVHMYDDIHHRFKYGCMMIYIIKMMRLCCCMMLYVIYCNFVYYQCIAVSKWNIQLIQLRLSFKTLNSERARDDGFHLLGPWIQKIAFAASTYVFCRQSSICVRYSCKAKFQSLWV
jgi:hypothetical protein